MKTTGYQGFSIISVIPCRGGSKGILRKNIKSLGGKPLVAYSIKASLESKAIDRTIVSTEDAEIKQVCLKLGAEVIDRPIELALDTSQNEEVMLHVLQVLRRREDYLPSYMVLLEPTCPFKTSKDIDLAVQRIVDSNADSLLSVYKSELFFWSANGKPLNYDPKRRPRRQDRKDEFIENGTIFITKAQTFLKEKCRLTGKIVLFEMPREISWEMDSPFDWEIAECIISKHRKVGGKLY